MAGRPDDTRTRLIEAAGEVFAEKGFQAATVREICSRAGANLAAVNYYFGDKKRLYVEVVGYAHRGLSAHFVPPSPPDAPPAERLRQFIDQSLVSLEQDEEGPAWGRRLMMREMSEPTEACATLVDQYVRPKAEALRQILAELLPPGTSEVEGHLIAYSIVGQCLFHRLHRPVIAILLGEDTDRTLDVSRVADHITRFTLAALGLGPPVVGRASTPSRIRSVERV